MRLRLVFLVSLAGAVLGSGAPIVVFIWVYGSMARATDPGITNRVTSGQLIDFIPLVVGLAGGIFVYRHTARRRKLQAVLTTILILLFSWIALVAATFLS